MKPKFYLTGMLFAIAVTALSVALRGVPDLFDEVAPIAAVMLIIFLPFGLLPLFGSASRSDLVSLSVVSAVFWLVMLAIAATSTGGASIGLGLVGLASPVIICTAAIALEAAWDRATRGRGRSVS
jgi:hypothetical protein